MTTDSPTVTLPEGDIPTEFSKATLKKGDGAVVEAGDQVLVQYHGVSWNTGEVFDESWGKQPFTFTVGSGVVQGFTDAVTGETVGSQVIAVLPPAVAYGEGEINDADLKGRDARLRRRHPRGAEGDGGPAVEPGTGCGAAV